MKMRIGKTIPFLIVLLLLVPFCACTGGGNSNRSVDLIKTMPEDSTSFVYWEVNTLGNDDALLDIYNKCKYSAEIEQLTNEESGIEVLSRADIDYAGRASGFGQSTVTVFFGEMDVDGIKNELDKREDYELVRHQETDIWTPEDTQVNKSIAVRDNMILMGNKEDIEACIDVIVLEQQRNLYEDKNINSVMDKLPNGVLMQVNKAGADPEEDYDDLKAYGKSYTKEGEEELKLTAVYMFEDYSATTAEVQDDIKAYLGTKGFRDPKVEQFEEKFLRVTAVIYTRDFVDILTW